MTRKPLVAANWKMNGSRAANAAWTEAFLPRVKDLTCDVSVFTPYVYLPQMSQQVKGQTIALGAQDVSEYENGAFTGEISAQMLRDVGASWVIIGHSERRRLFGDTECRVAAKCSAAAKAGLRIMLCVGETLQQREAGEAVDVVTRQLKIVIDTIGADQLALGAVAYEPIWAIGTGKTSSPDNAQQIHAALRQIVSGYSSAAAENLRIVYGGSVNPSNARELFAMPDIDGGLVGGASLKASDFYTICVSAQ